MPETTPLPSAVERLEALYLFLNGEGELDGCAFGERPEGAPAYWWRKHIKVIPEAVSTLKARPGVEEVVKILLRYMEPPTYLRTTNTLGDTERVICDDAVQKCAQAILALFPASLGGDLEVSPESPCAETGPNSPSSPETQQSISLWADETFGPAGTNFSVAARANQEMAELLTALAADDNHPKAVEECADIVIVLMRLIAQRGGDLQAAIDEKMRVNRERSWRLTGDGHGYHVKGGVDAAA